MSGNMIDICPVGALNAAPSHMKGRTWELEEVKHISSHDCVGSNMDLHVLDNSILPQTRHIRGTNFCNMNVIKDRIPGRAIIVSAIDNVVKGASGAAIQNMNLMLGLPENTGLNQAAMFP